MITQIETYRVVFMKNWKHILIIIFLMFSTMCEKSIADSIIPDCQGVVSEFLSTKNNRTITEISQENDERCWGAIKASNANLARLNSLVMGGSFIASKYLSGHLRELDGGNLEDALIALGVFGENNMEKLLSLEQMNSLTERELVDAITMLPLSLSENPDALLKTLDLRKQRIAGINRADLEKQKAITLKAIDGFISEIKEKIQKGVEGERNHKK